MAHDETSQTAGETAECAHCVLRRKAKQRRRSDWVRQNRQARILRNALERLAKVEGAVPPPKPRLPSARGDPAAPVERGMRRIDFAGTFVQFCCVEVLRKTVPKKIRIDSTGPKYKYGQTISVLERVKGQSIRPSIHGRTYGMVDNVGTVAKNARWRRREKRAKAILEAKRESEPVKTVPERSIAWKKLEAQLNPVVKAAPPRIDDGKVCFGGPRCTASRRTVHKVDYSRGHKCLVDNRK